MRGAAKTEGGAAKTEGGAAARAEHRDLQTAT